MEESRLEVYSRVAWRFMSSYTFAVAFCYLLMALLARRLKRLFQPMDLHRVLILHNVICVTLSAASAVTLTLGLWDVGTILKINDSNVFLRRGLWIYWISKYYELLDTVFMLLRHRLRQMSFLHVFHHASMAFLSDYSYNYAPWPPVAFGLAINACSDTYCHVQLLLFNCFLSIGEFLVEETRHSDAIGSVLSWNCY